ncbi:Transglutaminase-like superfamily-domain-containing protein [Fusarium flagelliforme]|uniref:Transglutaminase-like superfamily-domain-containing protein n=1 Tax=Fusarium flagelliforme TaxID=2675880 RepID=UPI001E8E3FEA|nr:Transglutaminase-like superfamily-domain-containing protein [Fusarium flagelliforme]KAH7192443.1 Transglutaminase-like superfamily-domain-containing protein [Fusarium flagelliforme]
MFFSQIPDEIIQHLLYYIPPEDNLTSFQFLSHRLRHLANEPLLWRYHCQTSFTFWHPEHNFHRRLKGRASNTPWKEIFLTRKSRNARVERLLGEVLETKTGRLKRYEKVCKLGYDAKDYLLEQCNADETAEDVLARRYHSSSLLDSIHRSLAIEEWHNIQQAIQQARRQANGRPTNLSLERALGAFDLFVLHEQPGDLEDIGHILDRLAADFRDIQPSIDEMSTRQKALELNRWLQLNNFTGLQHPERNYRNLRNCLIGQALRHEDHDSIPIISSAIFCCIAERLGLQAHCCAFPTHVHAIVFAENGKTLDSKPVTDDDAPLEKMYLDPYGSSEEIPLADLQTMLAHYGWQTSTDMFLSPVDPAAIAIRTARNIRATASRVIEAREQADPDLTRLITGNDSSNIDAALYSALWASLLLTPVDSFEWDEALEPFLHRFAKNWHVDAWLIEKYIFPLYDGFGPLRERLMRNRRWDDPREVVYLVGEFDDVPPPIFRRNSARTQHVLYKIGQVFKHRRYGWIGAVNGWTDQGTRRLPMPHTVAIDETLDDNSDTELPNRLRPRNKTFYTCLRTTGPERHVVAEDNIVLIDDPSEIPDSLFRQAGKFFKRFDAETCTFVSNITEQYPDD